MGVCMFVPVSAVSHNSLDRLVNAMVSVGDVYPSAVMVSVGDVYPSAADKVDRPSSDTAFPLV